MPKRVRFEGKVYNFPDDASDDEIAALLEGGERATEPAASAPVEAPEQPPAASMPSLPTPGILAVAGKAVERIPGAAAKAAAKTGRVMSKMKGGLAGAAGGTLGATVGAEALGPVIGPFGGASLGAYLGHRGAKKYLTPAFRKMGEYLTDIGAKRIPPAGRRTLVHGAQRIARPLGRLIPGIGTAMLTADVGNAGWQAGRKIDEMTGASDYISQMPGADALGGLLSRLLPDSLEAEIMKRGGR